MFELRFALRVNLQYEIGEYVTPLNNIDWWRAEISRASGLFAAAIRAFRRFIYIVGSVSISVLAVGTTSRVDIARHIGYFCPKCRSYFVLSLSLCVR